MRPIFFVEILVFVSLVGCSGDDPCPDGSLAPNCVEVSAPALRVTTSTTGADFDLSAYLLIVDTDTTVMGMDGAVVLRGYDVGDHQVHLVDIAANCGLAGPATVQAPLVAGDTVDVAFAVSCTALPPTLHDMTGTWIGQATKMSTQPLDAVATVTYVLQQMGDSVAVTSIEWVGPVRTLVSDWGAGRVSGDTFTLFDRTTTESGGAFRMTHTLTVSGTQMLGTTTEQFGRYTDSLALTKQ